MLVLKIHHAQYIVGHSDILHIMADLSHNLILHVLQISSLHVLRLNPITSKNQKNASNLNLSFTIPSKMTFIIIKFNVHNPNLIISTPSNPINVSNNAHQTHTLHTIHLIIIASHNVPTI